MPKLKSLTSEAERRAPGAFMPDGSWNENGELHHQGHVHRLIAALVRERRAGKLTPQGAAQTIRAANAGTAFPSVAQWATCDTWVSVWAATSAEECVRREGRGIDGHWCGPQRWLDGSDRECPEPRHRVQARPEDVAAALRAIHAVTAHMGGAPQVAPMPEIEHAMEQRASAPEPQPGGGT